MEKGEISLPQERKIERWKYDLYFREYILLLARKGKDGLESIGNFPKRIELNSIWHETLDNMREETKDGHERWALVGFRADMQHIVLPRIFGVGTKRDYQRKTVASVPHEVMWTEIQKAKEKTGVVDLVGDIHTHPGSPRKRTVHELFGIRRITGSGGGFSAADLYCMVTQEEFLPMAVVVDNGKNYFAFKTRESEDIPTSRDLFSQDAFEKYWYEKYGLKFEGEFAKYIPPNYTTLMMNKGIAERHSLILYKGKPDEDLVRLYPSS